MVRFAIIVAYRGQINERRVTMKNTRLTIYTFLMAIIFAAALCSCQTSARGTDLDVGETDDNTNDLTSPSSINLYLDQISFAGNIDPINDSDSHPQLEIHIMNEAGDSLLACTGDDQSGAMNSMGEDIITYGEIDAQFVAGSAASFASDTAITVRLINKGDHADCPSGYNSDIVDEHGHTTDPDLVLATVETTYGTLTSDGIEFTDVATSYFRDSTMEPREIAISENESGGLLTVDQFYLDDEDIDDAEYSQPELALFLAEYGSFDLVACADLQEVDIGSVIHGTLSYGFVDSSDSPVQLADIDSTKAYWFLLVEQDDERCPNASSIQGGNSILKETVSMTIDEFLNEGIEFEDSYGEFTLIEE